jgi:hypothetical protein
MAGRQTPPGGKGGRTRDHFAYVPTDAKTPWTAYVAGPCQWYECHTTGKTKACLDAVTGGELSCPRCGQIKPPETRGYLPLYRESDGRPVCVILPDTVREVADQLGHHVRILVGRERGPGNPVWVRKATEQRPRYDTTLPHRMRPADVWLTCIVLWAEPALIAWHNITRDQSTAQVYYTPRPEVAPVEESQPGPGGDGADPRAVADREALRRILDRRASTDAVRPNGSHKPKG